MVLREGLRDRHGLSGVLALLGGPGRLPPLPPVCRDGGPLVGRTRRLEDCRLTLGVTPDLHAAAAPGGILRERQRLVLTVVESRH